MIKLQHASYFRCVARMLCDLPLPNLPQRRDWIKWNGAKQFTYTIHIWQAVCNLVANFWMNIIMFFKNPFLVLNNKFYKPNRVNGGCFNVNGWYDVI